MGSGHRRTGTFGLGGAAILLPQKLHNARKHVLYKTQTAVKRKTFTFLTSNERILIPKLLLNPDFLEPPEETKIGSKNWIFREIWSN